MRRLFMMLIAALSTASADAAPRSTPEDIQAITRVTEEFQAAIIARDGKRLSSLVLNPNILFTSPATEEFVRRLREKVNPDEDGLPPAGFRNFVNFVANAKVPVQEKFSNVKITQDGHVAWVVFDYEFLEDNKVQNYGIESWNLVRRDGKWKIFSVVWSVNLVDAPAK